jgi:UDP-GlcNAc:undecaprenyl-phosphate GlcNAc-1-phosphate transferase
MSLPVVAVAVAMLVSVAVTPAIARLASALQWYDRPGDQRRVHTTPVPRLGGVAIFAAFATAMGVVYLIGQSWGHQQVPRVLWALCLGGGMTFLAGVADDVREMRPLVKLAAQTIAAMIAYAFGCRVETIGLASWVFALGRTSLPITLIWIVGVTNAFNLIDGLDGLATGVALVALCTVTVAAGALGNYSVVIPALALIGALTGFLKYNLSPARIFLGDSGSLFVGFSIAVLAIVGSVKGATATLAVIPLFALGLPLIDTGLAILRRWLRGLPVSAADSRHIHHRLIALGLTHRRAVGVLFSVAALFAVVGLTLAFAPPRVVWVTTVTGCTISACLFLLGMRRLNYHEFGEAALVLCMAPLRLRRAIADQINARDVANLVDQCDGVEAINATLSSSADQLGVLHVELCGQDTAPRLPQSSAGQVPTRPWRLDYPIAHRSNGEDFVLRIWCTASAARPYGAERVARILGPTIERSLASSSPVTKFPSLVQARAPARGKRAVARGSMSG